MLLARNVVT